MIDVDNQIDTTTGTVKVRAQFDNADNALFPNQFVNAQLLVNTLHERRQVPTAAIQRGAPGTFVYVINRRQHGVGAAGQARPDRRRRWPRSISGLSAGDRVVIDGTDRLRDGAKVTIPARAARRRRPSRRCGRAARSARRQNRSAQRRQVAPSRGERRPQCRGWARADCVQDASRGSERCDERLRALHPAAGRHHAADGGDPAGRHRRLPLPAALGAARGRLSDHPGADLLSRRQPGGDDLVGHRAARAAVRPDAGPQPDVVGQLGRRLGHHAAVQPRSQPRHRRAGGAGGDQRRRQSAAGRPAGAADLRQGQSGRRADPDARADLEDAAADRRCEDLADTRLAQKISQLPRRRAGQHQRRPAAGGAHPGQSAGARRLRAQHRRSAHHARQRQRQHAEGQFRRAGAGLHDQRQRPDRRAPHDYANLVIAYRNGAPVRLSRRRQRRQRRREHQARRLGEHHAGDHPQRPAPAGRQRHRRSSTASRRCCRSCRRRCRRRSMSPC